ncbi:uncharacterized protein LOC128870091 [Anastrepha ludens]|uniref:uncharacterized protein LOC128870091 n=1 Tax=Anastrepha ludens TaxID=28586 RepID=UPI0023B18C58|nr:uncharacterized protein LOC128870091 [Anastrepha ludens]
MFLRSGKEVNAVEIEREKSTGIENEEITQAKSEHINIEMSLNNQNSGGIEGKGLNVELLRMLTEKLCSDSRSSVSIESFAKIVPDYDGVSIPVKLWLKNFEDNAAAYELNEKQKYVNARNKMKGTAKLFLETVTVSNYNDLREALISEFDKQLSSAEVHQQLRDRRIKDSENIHEYILNMRKVAAMGSVEEASVIRYIIEGLKMRNELKILLLNSKTYKELLEQYEIIETMNSSKERTVSSDRKFGSGAAAATARRHNTQAWETNRMNERKQHCYNCGSTRHVRSECREETKCFKCNGNGHIAKNCAKQNVNLVSKRLKQMRIGGNSVNCLVDTGVDVTLMRYSTYKRLFQQYPLKANSIKLYGLGNKNTDVRGMFSSTIEVDGLKTGHTILVVDDNNIMFDALIGFDLIEKFTLTVNATGYTFTEKGVDTSIASVFNVQGVDEIDVPHKYKNIVNQMVMNYSPNNATEKCPVHLKIIPSNDKICFKENPSRLSAMENAVVKQQIEDWLQEGVIRESVSDVQ